MKKIKEFLSGKKTYILAGIAIAGVWIDYFFQLGISESCVGLEVCVVELSTAIQITFAALGFSTLRAGIAK